MPAKNRKVDADASADTNVPKADRFEAWVAELACSPHLTRKGHDVLRVLRTQPRLGAYASSRALADEAEVNVGTVVRAAQALGFSGWPQLQQEFRSRFMASLTAVEVADEHERVAPSALSSIAHDRDALAYTHRAIDADRIVSAAKHIHDSRRTVVAAQGSYAAVGWALAHNAMLAGYDVRHVADDAAMANTLSQLHKDDLIIAINVWHTYASTVEALAAAAAIDMPSILITDSNTPKTGPRATIEIAVPSEGLAFFPSMISALSVAQAIVVELAASDPVRTRKALTRADQQWRRFQLLAPGGR